MKSKFTSLIIFFSFILEIAHGQTVSAEFKGEILSYEAKNYSVKINQSEFGIQIIRGKKTVLSTTDGKFFFKRNKKEHYLTNVKSSSASANILEIIVNTTIEELTATVRIIMEENNLQITALTNDRILNDKMGTAINLKSAGHWYGGNITSTHHWPLETGQIKLDPFYATSNQTSPVWLTSNGAGVLVKTYELMGFSLNDQNNGIFSFHIYNTNKIHYRVTVGKTIVDSYYEMIRFLGKPEKIPPLRYFTEPIFNTWIEMGTKVSDERILKYATEIKRQGFPSKILDIDDKWTPSYGDFVFDKNKFENPERMFDELHDLGFKVALWVTPFVEKASENFKMLLDRKFLIMDEAGEEAYITSWWNGKAALIDLSNPRAYEWFLNQLYDLMIKYGVDGFKLDAGDAKYLSQSYSSYARISPNEYTDLFAGMGQHFEINELRVSWLTQPLGLVQRLRDKAPTYSSEDGLNTLIPHGMSMGLIGYPYFCPDMIGGGLDAGFKNENYQFDNQLFIRWTQASALMPMMQFSLAPWRVDDEYIHIIVKYAKLHSQLGDYIYDLALRSKETGEPIVKPLFFRNPEDKITYTISDQFLLGDKFLVAPVTIEDTNKRDVYLPKGTWIDFWNGTVYHGGQTIKDYPAPLEKLPVFISIVE